MNNNRLFGNIRKELGEMPDGRGFNIGYAAVDRHAEGANRNHLALRWLGEDGDVRDFTYNDLKNQSNRFANVLTTLGVGKGDGVFVLTGRIPQLHIAALGILKAGAVFCPLFSIFGPEPIFQRLSIGHAKVLVTTQNFYRQKISGIRDRLPELAHILLTDTEEDWGNGLWSLPKLMSSASKYFTIPQTDPDDTAMLHFTSGTTGMPKAAVHVHEAAIIHYFTGKSVLDLKPEDVFWCTAASGWVTGTCYGYLAPLLCGTSFIVDEAEFDAAHWYSVLESQEVSVWYTAPTAIRMLMRLNIEPRKIYDLSRLRLIFSVGEPLNPEAIAWSEKMLGLPIRDTWWQTETGGIVIANSPGLDIRPGSMGKPIDGITAAIVKKHSSQQLDILSPGQIGHLALRADFPSLFRDYLHETRRYRECFADNWYVSEDLAKQDEDGYFWFIGRADDMIKTAGHIVGPFEVESALMEHPAVAEAGVVGKPDAVVGEIVKAFISLKNGFEPTDSLKSEIIAFARRKLGPAVAPREIEFEQNLPKNRAGKIMRRLLRERKDNHDHSQS